MCLGLISRTVFIQKLGDYYLGVNGLLTNILGILSMAELGMSTIMNYSLYKPVADHDMETIKSQMSFFRRAYYIIFFTIIVLGILLLPFLPLIAKDAEGRGEPIQLYYIVFLFNTAISYLVSYQFSLVNAEQKTYIYTTIHTAFSIILRLTEIVVLLLNGSFLLYLLMTSVNIIGQKLFLTLFFRKMYPFLYQEKARKLTSEELGPIKKNIIGIVYHKFSDIAIHSTDNIIISAAVNLTAVGFVSNYSALIAYAQTFLNIIFNNVAPSLGNLVAVCPLKEQFRVYKIYNFIDFWLFGFFGISFAILLQPFITLWIGAGHLIDEISLLLISVNFFLSGQRTSFLNYKSAHGKFYEDKYVVFVAAIINLVVSIALVNVIGLPGIYIGTLASGLYQSIRRPMIAYRRVTGDRTINYFKTLATYFCALIPPYLILRFISLLLLSKVSWPRFLLLALLDLLFSNLFFFLFFRKKYEFSYCQDMVFSRLRIINHLRK